MNYELLEALNQIAREKNVDREVLIETLIAGLLSAARRKYGLSSNIDMRFDRDRGLVEATLTRRVVATVEDPAIEVSLEEAREKNPEIMPGAELVVELDVQEFGRGAASAAKQVLVQRVREAERERIYEEFHDRVGELIHGIVQQVDRRNVLIRVDGVEAILPEREALFRDRFRQGDHVTAMLLDVDRMSKGPQVALTRSHPDFVRRLFEQEVPEIAEKIVEIRSISREAGSRSKVAVFSHDDRVDAVGACVGVKGSRVQNIVRELGGERIDIVPWSSDAALFVTRALSPAKVQRVDVDEESGGVTVIVPDDQLSLAIGKGGQNVRLAMKLTGWNIELVSDQQLVQAQAPEEAADFDLEEIEDRLGPKLTEKLIQAGLETARDVLGADQSALMEIEGVGPKTAEKVLIAVRAVYEGRLATAQSETDDDSEADDDTEDAVAEVDVAEDAAAEVDVAEDAAAEVDVDETESDTDGTSSPGEVETKAEDTEAGEEEVGTETESANVTAEAPTPDGADAEPKRPDAIATSAPTDVDAVATHANGEPEGDQSATDSADDEVSEDQDEDAVATGVTGPASDEGGEGAESDREKA